MMEMEMENGIGSSSSSCSCGTSSITDMSHDQLLSILLLLPLESILSFVMTCKKTFALSRSNSLWKSLCSRDWGHSTVDSISSTSSSSSSSSLDWIRLYKRLRNLDRVSCFHLTHTTTDALAPTPRASHSLNFLSGSLLLFGGGCDGGRHLDDTWIGYLENGYNKRTVKWQKQLISRGPSGRFGHSCIAIGNYLVLFGGINDSGIRQNDTWIAQLASVDGTDNTLLSWRLLDVGPVAPPPRGAHACCSIDNQRMLIHGGIGLFGTRLADTWVLYLSENFCFGTWNETLSLSHPVPSPRSGHTLTCIGGTGNRTVLFGGRGMGYEVLSDVWYFDSSEEGRLRWVPVVFELRNIPGGLSLARVGHSATCIPGGRVLIYGGEDSYRHRKDDFWLLDITQSQEQRRRRVWRKLKCEGYQPKSRSFHQASADESGFYIYVLGGMVDGILQPAEPTGLRFDGELFLVQLADVC